MAEFLEIQGGKPLFGSVKAGGAKNAALPQLIASLLTGDKVSFSNVPNLEDVSLTLKLLETLGAKTKREGDKIEVATPSLIATEASYSLVKALRASFWVLGPLLARGRAARVALPGGDIIGARPVDMHLSALTQLGADINIKNGIVYATAVNGLKPANIEFRFPSVGATHQILMAASLIPGTTVLKGVAKEPEVVALAEMLISMGADIEGHGTEKIVVKGVEVLNGATINLIGDRIEAGTYLLAGIASRGEVQVNGIDPGFLTSFLNILKEMGVEVLTGVDWIRVKAPTTLKPVHVVTGPFPELATDLQAPLMAALCTASGTSTLDEKVFEGRFGNVSLLCRMGAKITVHDQTATIEGVEKLQGAPVDGLDIRAAASLVVAALGAEGLTTIGETHHLRRGYEYLERKLNSLNARIGFRIADADDYMFTGC